ncbi:protein piccolo [Pelomyxa schiedti]|nr:protein piccolo [Pelomyxa schiedti]
MSSLTSTAITGPQTEKGFVIERNSLDCAVKAKRKSTTQNSLQRTSIPQRVIFMNRVRNVSVLSWKRTNWLVWKTACSDSRFNERNFAMTAVVHAPSGAGHMAPAAPTTSTTTTAEVEPFRPIPSRPPPPPPQTAAPRRPQPPPPPATPPPSSSTASASLGPRPPPTPPATPPPPPPPAHAAPTCPGDVHRDATSTDVIVPDADPGSSSSGGGGGSNTTARENRSSGGVLCEGGASTPGGGGGPGPEGKRTSAGPQAPPCAPAVCADGSSSDSGSQCSTKRVSVDSTGSAGGRASGTANGNDSASNNGNGNGNVNVNGALSAIVGGASASGVLGGRAPSILVPKREYLPGPDGKRQRVLEELYTTEKTYLRGLGVLINEYLNPIKETGSSIMKPTLIPIIFHNITDIEKLSSNLCEALKQYDSSWTPESSLADVFSPFVASISAVYTPYIQNYDKCVQAIYSLNEKSKAFTTFIENVKAKPASEGKDLAAYLITPIQRVPRYTLLLKEYLKVTPAEHPDSSGVNEVCHDLESLAASVNVSIKQEQNRNKLIEIEKSFVKLSADMKEQILSDHLFIREGYLFKECRKSDKKRHFWLFSDCLIYGSPVVSQSGKTTFLFHRSFPVSKEKLKVIPIANEDPLAPTDGEIAKYPFQIIAHGKSFTVYAEERPERDGWLLDFNEILFGARGVGTSQIITQGSAVNTTQAPVWLQDKKSLICMICGQKFTVIKRRHHCRNCGKIMCGKCCHLKRVLPHIGEEPVRVCKFCMEFLDLTEQEEKNKLEAIGTPPKTEATNSVPSPIEAPDSTVNTDANASREVNSTPSATSNSSKECTSVATKTSSNTVSSSSDISTSAEPTVTPTHPAPDNQSTKVPPLPVTLPSQRLSLPPASEPSVTSSNAKPVPNKSTSWLQPNRAVRPTSLAPFNQPSYVVLSNTAKTTVYIIIMILDVDTSSVVISLNVPAPPATPKPTSPQHLMISGTTHPAQSQSFSEFLHTKEDLEVYSSTTAATSSFSLTVPLPHRCSSDNFALSVEQGRLVVRLCAEPLSRTVPALHSAPTIANSTEETYTTRTKETSANTQVDDHEKTDQEAREQFNTIPTRADDEGTQKHEQQQQQDTNNKGCQEEYDKGENPEREVPQQHQKRASLGEEPKKEPRPEDRPPMTSPRSSTTASAPTTTANTHSSPTPTSSTNGTNPRARPVVVSRPPSGLVNSGPGGPDNSCASAPQPPPRSNKVVLKPVVPPKPNSAPEAPTAVNACNTSTNGTPASVKEIILAMQAQQQANKTEPIRKRTTGRL